MRKPVIILFFMILFMVPVFSFTDQTTTERVLGENKEFIEFINVCMSNFGEEKKDKFFEVYQKHFNAEVAYLQSDYKRAFKNVYSSQRLNVDLYEKVLGEYYLEESKSLLDKIAPEIIRSKNAAARLYLSLAYRDRALSKNIKVETDATRPHLRSYKIYNYLEAIKLTRRSMRYGLLSLFESQDVETKKAIYDEILKNDRDTEKSPFYGRFLEIKGDKEYVDESNRQYEDYEKKYLPVLEQQQKEYEEYMKASGASDQSASTDKAPADKTVSATPATPVPAAPAATTASASTETESQKKTFMNTKYLFEKKVERRARFRQEKRVAEYLRNGDFKQAEDIIRKYVDDFNFKLINATLMVVKNNKTSEYPTLDFDKLKLHHMDNNARIVKDSMVDGFSAKVKVVDEIKKGGTTQIDKPAKEGSAASGDKTPTDTVPPTKDAAGKGPDATGTSKPDTTTPPAGTAPGK